MVARTLLFMCVSLATLLTTVLGGVSNPLPLPLPTDPLDDSSPNYLPDAHCIQEFDGTTTRKICHDYFRRTVCYCVEPAILPLPTFEFAQVRVKEYYNAGLNRRFVKNYTCIEKHDPAESLCLDRYDGELRCMDYVARSANSDGTARLNRLCYDRAVDEVTGQGPHVHESWFDATLTFNTQVRRLKAAEAYMPPSMVEVNEVCAPLCGEQGLTILGDTLLPRKSYFQLFTKFDSIETCDGCSIRKGGW
ncbi:MAG: hypothetical protein L6R36_002894 [Xanthoria steineri]|nr:MAG: hypothetical protein L6R36_002894 [Xanthoria steineri]